MIEVNNC